MNQDNKLENYQLASIREQGLSKLRECSRKLRQGDAIIDCSDVFGLEISERKALFKYLPRNLRGEDLDQYFDLDTIEADFYEQLYRYTENRRTRNSQIKRSMIYGGGGLLFLVLLFFGITGFRFMQSSKISSREIVIGTLWNAEAQRDLQDYLENKLVPNNYWHFLLGKEINIIINGDRTLPYGAAERRMESQKWDIAFATSPILSIYAEEQGYQFVARMFPGSDSYQSGIFVRKDSSIDSLNDINSEHTIALGKIRSSASSFYMPVYNLYGKTLKVDHGNRASEIMKMVKTGEADLGAGAVTDERVNDPDLRMIHQSRNIPTSGVYLSPKLSQSEQKTLKKLLFNAPDEIKDTSKSNYEQGPHPDYEQFREVMNRVNKIAVCSDFRENPVDFFCSPDFEIASVTGKINGWSLHKDDQVTLNLVNSEGVYELKMDKSTLEQALELQNINEVNGKVLEVTTPKDKWQEINEELTTIEVQQPNQIKQRSNSNSR